MILTKLCVNPNLSNCNLVKVINLVDSDSVVNWQCLLLHSDFSASALPRTLEIWLHITPSRNFMQQQAKNPQELLFFKKNLQYYLNYCFHDIQTLQ